MRVTSDDLLVCMSTSETDGMNDLYPPITRVCTLAYCGVYSSDSRWSTQFLSRWCYFMFTLHKTTQFKFYSLNAVKHLKSGFDDVFKCCRWRHWILEALWCHEQYFQYYDCWQFLFIQETEKCISCVYLYILVINVTHKSVCNCYIYK